MATIKGKWVFNEILEDFNAYYSVDGTQVNFVSNDTQYTGFSSQQSFGDNAMQQNMAYAQSGNVSFGVYSFLTSSWIVDVAYRTVDFGTTEQTVSDTFLTWMQANATQIIEPETTPTTITYNGSTLAELEAGQTATFPQGVKAKTDVSIAFGSKGSITYKGVTTAIEAGKTANLLCAGKKFGTDVVVSVEKEADPLVGEWVANNTSSTASATIDPAISSSVKHDVVFADVDTSIGTWHLACCIYFASPKKYCGIRLLGATAGVGRIDEDGKAQNSSFQFNIWNKITIFDTIYDENIVVNPSFIDWLKANFTKVS